MVTPRRGGKGEGGREGELLCVRVGMRGERGTHDRDAAPDLEGALLVLFVGE